MKIINPATGALVAELPEDAQEDIARKLARARAAQPGWAATPLAERLAIVARFRDALGAHKDELARTLTREMGKPITQAANELSAMSGRLEFFLRATPEVVAPETVFEDATLQELISEEPLGVVANVSAWNYPYFVGSNVFIPALLTGNTVLYKPSELTSMTGLAIADLLHAAGVPTDAFLPVIGPGSVGQDLVRLDVDGVFFTGSHATGQKIAAALAGRFIRTQFELGGKDPTYVCDDVDARAAAEGLADGAFYNTGQSCCSVERIYVHQEVAGPFIEAFTETVRAFRLGDPEDPATYIGPLARAPQLGVLEAQVRDAVSRGARLLCGGQRVAARAGNFFEPTVLVNVSSDMAVMREESFGPIIGIETVPDDESAVERMNDSDYGLTAGVYSADRERARAILSRLDAGSVYWNCCDRVSPRLPWTGRKHSGMGSTLSKVGIAAFLQPKAWHLRRA
jgi:acyl-CoA reductase-like NAD-dependent aldehyde dehydrogenase